MSSLDPLNMVNIDLNPREAQALGAVLQEKLGAIHQQKELEAALLPIIKKLLKPQDRKEPQNEE